MHHSAGVLACLLLAAPVALATTADDICPPGTDPCVLQKGVVVPVDDGSTLDFGNRALVLPTGSGTKLDIGSGFVTIHAGSVTLNPGSSIIGAPACVGDLPPPGGSLTIMVDGDCTVLRDGSAKARIDVSNCANPGAIVVHAGGSVYVEGTLNAQGTQNDAGFGTVEIVAGGKVVVSGEISVAGGALADGGDLFVRTETGDINISGSIDCSGGNGGSIDLAAGSRVVTSEGGPLSRIDARATAGGGTGGIIDLAADGDVTVGSPLHAQGEPDLFLGGDGGEVLLTALGSVSVGRPVNIFGTLPDGVGGDADVFAALDIVQNGSIDASGRRTYGLGGLVGLLAQRNLTVGSIDVSADCEECAGGDLELEAWCALTVPSTAVLAAEGPIGVIGVRTGGPATVDGSLRAGGSVEFLYHPSAPAPDLTGANIDPTPTVIADPGLTRCGGPGTCNLDGVIDEGEECDDGNDVACDACSNSCKLVVCGNGHLDTPCEACDDGNKLDCDGCRGDCSRPDNVCGDGIVECGEECDPGTAVSCDAADACSATCTLERCGNGVLECSEECDEGLENGQVGSRCSANCTRLPPPNCGDGIVMTAEGEQCDDGNTVDCDGCNHLCETEGCGNNVRECSEECDDGNSSSCDGCTAACLAEECGNGRVDCGEECDEGDRNGLPDSGCLAHLCRFGELCTMGSTGPCIPCVTPVDCDPLGRCANVDCVDGVCMAASLVCDDGNPCTLDEEDEGGCDALTGCTYALRDPTTVPECNDGDPCTDPVCTEAGCGQAAQTGFDSARCRLDDLEVMLASDAVDEKARSKLTKLHDGAAAKVEMAAGAADAGKRAKARAKLRRAAKIVARFAKKVVKLQPAHITDPGVGSQLSAKSQDARVRIEALRDALAH
jgi:cysteine-rich repeat protein